MNKHAGVTRINPGLLKSRNIHRGDNRADGIGRGPNLADFLQGDTFKQSLHIRQRTDVDPHLANLPGGHRMVGIVAALGGQIERNREAGLTPLQQGAIAQIGFFRRAKAGVHGVRQ